MAKKLINIQGVIQYRTSVSCNHPNISSIPKDSKRFEIPQKFVDLVIALSTKNKWPFC